MFGGAVGRQAALRLCLREGAMTLAWDPPERWRMDVSFADGTLILVSAPRTSYLCRSVAGGVASCADRSSPELEDGSPFPFILMRPRQVLDEIGARVDGAVTLASERTIAGLTAECFSAAGSVREKDRVEWCYSDGGLLLFLSTATEEGGSAILEANEVSTEVSDADFSPPLGRRRRFRRSS